MSKSGTTNISLPFLRKRDYHPIFYYFPSVPTSYFALSSRRCLLHPTGPFSGRLVHRRSFFVYKIIMYSYIFFSLEIISPRTYSLVLASISLLIALRCLIIVVGSSSRYTYAAACISGEYTFDRPPPTYSPKLSVSVY